LVKKAASRLRRILSGEARMPQTLVPAEYIQQLLKLTSQVINVPGDILEVGVYQGGSLYRTAKHLTERHPKAFAGRELIGIDTFEGHPYINAEKDPAHHFKGRFADTSFETVSARLKRFPFVRVIQGECGAAFRTLPAGQRFCLANLDVDIYDSYVRALEYVYPRLSPGGVIVCDEYQGYGHREFIDRYFKDKPVEVKLRTGRAEGKDYGVIITKRA
jgi:predicted O-methyltransferase YrrM